jgi:putative tricarboxylic transport membrane protein
MVKADRWIGFLFALFSLYVCVESVRLGLGTYQQPGAGFVPFCAGVILGVLSLALIFLAFVRDAKKAETWHNPDRILMVFLAILGFTLLLEWLGFILSALLLIWFLLKVVERRGWSFSVGVALLVAGASYVVFDVWLRAQLPAGILGS